MFTPEDKGIYAADAYFGIFYASLDGLYSIHVNSTDIFPLVFKKLYAIKALSLSLCMTYDG